MCPAKRSGSRQDFRHQKCSPKVLATSATAKSNRGAVIAAAIVFLVAMVIRLPSCYESFWVDELHSAWCVWDALADVAPRARLGNQSPIYFGGLWFWKQAFGCGEVALRMSSVLMTSIAAAVMTWGVNRWTGSRIGGVAAGLVMALESNAIFFGTEIRPYAVVILSASIATICFVKLLESDSPYAWNILAISVLVALATQPTSFGVLVWLPALVGLKRLREEGFKLRLSLSNLLLITALVAVGWALWTTTLGSSWRSRGNWATFAMAPEFRDAVAIWDWTWLLVIPLVIALFCPGKRPAMVCVALIAVSATFAFWIASRLDVVHLWHRRYLVSTLPMFALLVGGAVGKCRIANRGWLAAPAFVAIVLLLGLTWSQGVLQTLCTRPHLLAYRGEDWRSAVGWVQSQKGEKDTISLDPGLIESRILSQWRTIEPAPTIDDLRYLRYPVSGPYRLENVRLIPPIGMRVSRRESIGGYGVRVGHARSSWIIARTSGETASQFAVNEKQENLFLRFGSTKSEVRSFGGVSVIRFQMDVPKAEVQKAINEFLRARNGVGQ
ncbi:glycosyltransferase family 39 protein [Rubripirellula obstinata]|uniref:glycosyltransferase family 39 protein n=1 Tax=Rubripirellula obstinata TaxID=406547 RepID=UPI00082D6B56|nr:glycosyltransferase family 39 protein [Rubripirellula obstinata]